TEVDEGTDATEETTPKGTLPVLKLAQLPPRAPANSKFKEGVHYQRLAPTQPVEVSPDQVQIAEMFWYGCPHCNALDPRLEEWRKSTQPNGKAPYVAFTRIPATWNDITRFHARFYFAAQSLGKLEELHPLIFREIHMNGNPLNTLDKAREFFAAHGVDANDFQKNFGAMSLERKIDNAVLWAQRYRISSVPTFVVNGKYITDVGMAGSEDQLFELLNELAAREHAKE
ncbi:MAG TPA: thiol:disulfide interchange protein DsbA/DsbL, partial [Steroidobacteraceae bacterium]|nr:thiol:disulfide interchange protein DsbA/DsbL [Steroidobacteraceae bacterium]